MPENIKIVSIEDYGTHETYDIWNQESDCFDEEGNFFVDNIVVHNSILKNGVRRFEDLLLLNGLGHPGPMQCVRSDSKINIESGLKQISELDAKTDKILAAAKDETIYTDSYYVQSSGDKEIFRIKLEDGTEIFVGGDHKICVGDSFVEASKLSAGQDVVVYRKS